MEDDLFFTVAPEEAGQRLDVVLGRRFPDFSRTKLAELARRGLVTASGRRLKPAAPLSPGWVIQLPRPQPPTTEMRPDPEVRLNILYEDDHLLALDKPPGLTVHPGAGTGEGGTLAAGLLAYNPALGSVGEPVRPGLVHRLDRDTSGILITAKTEKALYGLTQAFSRREVDKYYLAFIRGAPPRKAGLIDRPIGRHPTQRHKMAVGHGRPAQTAWRVLKSFDGVSLLHLRLFTGRTHQIRVHLASLGAPVLGDRTYGGGIGELERRRPELAPFWRRQLLHARRLSFRHPISGRPMSLLAPWPLDFLDLWSALRG